LEGRRWSKLYRGKTVCVMTQRSIGLDRSLLTRFLSHFDALCSPTFPFDSEDQDMGHTMCGMMSAFAHDNTPVQVQNYRIRWKSRQTGPTVFLAHYNKSY